jgi:hypothetical protein
MEAGKFSFKFSRQTQKNLVGSSKYAYFRLVAVLHTAKVLFILDSERKIQHSEQAKN